MYQKRTIGGFFLESLAVFKGREDGIFIASK